MQFEWDENKNKLNIKNHGIDFQAASTVFLDENRVEIPDTLHSQFEERFVVLGLMAGTPVVLFVVYTERGKVTRLISAREATREEEEGYYNGYYSL